MVLGDHLQHETQPFVPIDLFSEPFVMGTLFDVVLDSPAVDVFVSEELANYRAGRREKGE